MRLAQAALGTAGVWCVFLTAEDWFGRRAAWIAGAAAALTGVFTFYEALILQASLDPFLTAAALACLTRALTRRDERWFGAAGFAFAIQSMNRPNVLIPALVIGAALLFIRRWRGASWLALGLVVGLAPVSARNRIVTGEWSLLSSQGGLNLYIICTSATTRKLTAAIRSCPASRRTSKGRRTTRRWWPSAPPDTRFPTPTCQPTSPVSRSPGFASIRRRRPSSS